MVKIAKYNITMPLFSDRSGKKAAGKQRFVFNNLSSRIFILTASVALLVSAIILVAVWLSVVEHARLTSEKDMQRAQLVVQQALAQRARALQSSVEVLTSDFGFKQTVASRDVATIESALDNHGERIGADLMLLLNLDGDLVAASHSSPGYSMPAALKQRIADEYVGNRSRPALHVIIDGAAYQVILLPVYAPLPIALAAIGFELDARFLDELLRLAGTHISLVQNSNTQRRILLSTLPDGSVQQAINASGKIASGLNLPLLDSQKYLSKSQPLATLAGEQIELILTIDLKQIFASYDLLRRSLFLINCVTLLIAIAGSVLVSHTLSTPLARLESAVRRFALGERHELPRMDAATQEIKSLFDSFNRMQSDLEKRESHIRYQAHHDVLTGLLNRTAFTEGVANYVDSSPDGLAVINLNVCGFKKINDSFGPVVGDNCLKLLAQRLRSAASRGQLVARCGADEFYLALPLGLDQEPEDTVQSLLAVLHESFEFDGLRIQLQFNLGVALFPAHAMNAEQLMRRSSIALDMACEKGKSVAFYQAGREEELLDQLSLMEDLKRELQSDGGQLHMNYQPKQNLASGEIDKSFVLHLDQSESDQIIVSSTIELAHNFGLRVIAEGVENEASKELLFNMGCDYIQGYHLARPMPAGRLQDWLRALPAQRQPSTLST